ncbi:MAG: hypothetical protein AB7I18_02740 [Candidatus Berkiella sp.]
MKIESISQLVDLVTLIGTIALPLPYWVVLLSVTAAIILFKFEDIKQSKLLKRLMSIGVIGGAILGLFPAVFLSLMATDSGTTQSMITGGVMFGLIELVSALAGLVVATPVGYLIFRLSKTA